MPSEKVQELYDEWGEETVKKAFLLQGKIKKEGLDGIHFMHDEGQGRSAESKAKQVKYRTVKSTIEGEMDETY